MSITPGSSLCLRTLGCLTFPAASYEAFTGTAPHTWNLREQNEDTSYGQRSTTRLSCEWFSFCNGLRPDLPMAPRIIIPRSLDSLDFLQPAQCAYADDIAVSSSSFRESMFALALAFRSVDCITGLNLNYRKCCWVQYGNEEHASLRTWISENCEQFREMQIVRHAKYVGTMIGPDGYLHRWAVPRTKFVQRVMKINASTKSLVEQLCDFKIYAISVLSFTGSVCDPDKATLKARTMPFSVPQQDRTTLSPLNYLRLAPSVDMVLI